MSTPARRTISLPAVKRALHSISFSRSSLGSRLNSTLPSPRTPAARRNPRRVSHTAPAPARPEEPPTGLGHVVGPFGQVVGASAEADRVLAQLALGEVEQELAVL